MLDFRSAHAILEDPRNQFCVSSASIWETSIKHALKPESIPVSSGQMVRFCRESGITELPVMFAHAQRVAALPVYHNDPFDRMLVAQAQSEGLYLLSHGGKLPPYGDFVVQV